MKAFILTILLSYFSFFLVAKTPDVNIYFVYENSSLSSTDIKNQIDFVYLKNKIKANTFTVLHYTKNNEVNDSWGSKSKQIIYKPKKTGCDFSICNDLLPLINYQINKDDINKFYNCETKLSCNLKDFNFEIINLSNKNESTLINILSTETKQKTSKKINLYFYFSENTNKIKPSISFQTDSITYKEGSPGIKLNPIYSENIKNVFWEANDGLSCRECKYPSITPSKSTTLYVTGIDSFGCKSETKSIKIDFIKYCAYGKGECRLIFDDANFEKGPQKAIYEFKIYSEESTDKKFYVLAKPNCASTFNVIIKNEKDKKEIYSEIYEIKDVDKRGNHHKFDNVKYDHYSFLLDLIKINFKQNPNDVYRIEIHSFDEDNNKLPTYISPKISFSECIAND